MLKQKPYIESITPNYGSSFRVVRYDEKNSGGAPFWHFHPELQISWVNKGNGKRHIGNHLSYFRRGDLLMIGANLPHYGITDQLKKDQKEVVIQFKEDFLGKDIMNLPEMNAVKLLFQRAKFGIAFKGKAKKEIGKRIEGLYDLKRFERLMGLLDILVLMAESTDYELLNAKDYVLEVNQLENERIRSIYQFVRVNFQERITLDEISSEASMTVPAFCRYFKKQSGKTFTQFVNEFRIIHACKLLAESDLTISAIALESGFNNFSHFNRLFRKIMNQSPKQYREDFKEIVV